MTEIASTFPLDYFERHGFALLKLRKQRKNPVGENWQLAASRNPPEWRAWCAVPAPWHARFGA
jgi:hypothetical protein